MLLDLKDALYVALINNPNDGISDPLESRADEFDGWPTNQALPPRRNQVLLYGHVNFGMLIH